MKHLSGLDNLFLSLDRGTQYMHVGGVGIYDPSTAPGGKVRFKSILNFFAGRLHQIPVFRRRLVETPLGLDRPYWVDDGEIDIEYHVRHIALPQPGDWRQLMIQVARIHSRPLDLSKPLWEAYVIEGLENIPGIPPDSFALYIKLHHAVMDGEAGAQMIRAIHAATADAVTEPEDTVPTMVVDRSPTPTELYLHALANRSRQIASATSLWATLGVRALRAGYAVTTSGELLQQGRQYLKRLLATDAPNSSDDDRPHLKPHTRFDAEVSAHRVVDAAAFPLSDCAKIRQRIEGVTVNDILMTSVGGALRSYLEAHRELPDASLSAMVPLSTRNAQEHIGSGNHIGLTAVALRTDIADPLKRLHAVSRVAGKRKALASALGRDLPARLIEALPASWAAKLMVAGISSVANVTVSNVHGPDEPLYLAGAQMQLLLPVSIPFNGLGLNITGFSYNGTMWVCFVSCRQMIPDPANFAEHLQHAFEDLVQAAVAAGPRPSSHAARAKPKPAPRRRRTASMAPAAGRERAVATTVE